MLEVLIAIFILISVSTKRTISKPIVKLIDMANKLAIGDVNVEIDINDDSKNEIDILRSSMGKMAISIQEQAIAAEKISQGELNVQVIAKSDKDVLAISMKKVVEELQSLVEESNKLTEAAIEGELKVRGNADKFQGGYYDII